MHTPGEKKEEKFPQSTAQTALFIYDWTKENWPSSKSYKTRKRKQKCIKKGRANGRAHTHTLERTVAREEKLVLM